MTIETKHNIGDEVWFINLRKEPMQAKIFRINVEVRRKNIYVEYSLSNKEFIVTRKEDELFPTKEELLKSL